MFNLAHRLSLDIRWVLIILIVYIPTSLYLLITAISSPFVGIELKQKGEKFVVENIYYEDWAAKHQLTAGDIILEVDDIPISSLQEVRESSEIRDSKKLTLLKENGQIVKLHIKHSDIPRQFYMHIILPGIYFLMTILISTYLYFYKRHIPLIKNLIIFLIVVSLAYISMGASGRGNILGQVIISSSMVLCLVLLIQFLKDYFSYLQIKGLFIKRTELLYTLPCLLILSRIASVGNPIFNSITSWITLSSFCILLFLILFILMSGYIKYNLPQLKILFIGIIIPFLPFLSLFVLPIVLLRHPIIPSDISALFLFLIPLNFIFMRLTDRLFDIEYYLSRIRYYGFLSLISASILTLLYILYSEDYNSSITLVLFSTNFLVILILLYFKEKIDFHQRKILFTTHGNSIHNVYTDIHTIGQALNQNQLLNRLTELVTKKIAFNIVNINTYHTQQQDTIVKALNLGKIKKQGHVYFLLLHSTTSIKIVLEIGSSHQTIQLKKEEIIWLELIAIYCEAFLHNIIRIEELVKEIQSYQDNSIPWLDKLVWNMMEKEKTILSQELHDTILQELLFLARELDLYINNSSSMKINNIREQLLDTTYFLREYCENLNPPLLNTLGLIPALLKLIQKIKMRANFILNDDLEEISLKDPSLPLIVFRIVQELLNNALKHSNASNVTIKLLQTQNGFRLIYQDNGVGFDINKVRESESMGIRGLYERVRAFNGDLQFITSEENGVRISIEIIEDGDNID
ncbi:ATP-binding protein [Terribacillus saccharophilus]|uniref:PDZ domain-containing protein n=1 Tax=Terribacillus saccharophilus TaxID=361277 RepID=A0A268AG92_9BACI|nr:ATP-binding protein [Terribacillus saccharophilus]PAD23145.1 hypothetical protein CHH64_00580 [Terribacillus saccharophilus]